MAKKHRAPHPLTKRDRSDRPRSRARPGYAFTPKAEYDATIAKKNIRKAPSSVQMLEDRHLPGDGRRVLLATNYDQLRNFPLAGWALRKHLDYVCHHTLQIRTKDRGFNNAMEALWASFADDPVEYHAGGLHDHADMMCHLEAGAVMGGDILDVLRADGRTQLVESDCVRDPQGHQFDSDWIVVDGIHRDHDGRALHYAIHNRGADGYDWIFDQWLPAEWVIPHGYYIRSDQVRGITPIAPGLTQGQDLHESHANMLLNIKMRNAFLATVYRDPPSGPARPNLLGDSQAAGDGVPGSRSNLPGRPPYPFNPLKGPAKVELAPGDRMEFLESKSPSMESQAYIDRVLRFYLLCWDIPATLYDVKGSTYSGARQELIQYYQSIKRKRRKIVRVSDRIFRWRLARWIADKTVTLPDGFTVDTLPRQWLASGLPWIDPLKEMAAHEKALNMRVTTRGRITREVYGEDFEEIVEELKREEDMLKELPSATAAALELAPLDVNG